MPPVASRRSFTAAFKLEVVQYAEENGGNMAAQRKYGVSEKVVRGWRKQKDVLRQMKKTKKALRGNKARWPDLEDQLESFVLEQRAACRALSTVQIRLKAVEMAKCNLVLPFHEKKKPLHQNKNYASSATSRRS